AGFKVTLDSRHRLFEHAGVDVATPSEPELEAALGRPLGDGAVRERAARDALARLRAEALVLPRGSLGMELLVRDRETLTIPAFGDEDVTDVTGAGDTVIAVLTLALAAGADHALAARLANAAAGIVVTKLGTATVSADELARALEEA
ncbi:MAG: PfkB family carbohydrate kinase, partial [Planctomycetota bacterium]